MLFDRCCGTLYGALIGDAFGGRYEFADDDDFLELQNTIPLFNSNGDFICREFIPILGEGIWDLTPGQITDDGELTLTLAAALITNSKNINIQESIASMYRGWYESNPFDIGESTKNSFSQKTTKEMLEASKKYHLSSGGAMSNGMLMRISPIAIVVAGMISQIQTTFKREINSKEYASIRSFVKQDTFLTHHSEEALDYTTSYVLFIAYNIVNGGGSDNISNFINLIKKHQNINSGDWYKIFMNGFDLNAKLAHSPQTLIGDCRIAYQLAIRKGLLVSDKRMDFTEAIVSTVKLGGDTDTNACIVGAMCGSIVGMNGIPKEWISTIKSTKCERYKQYPINLYIKQIEEVAKKLFNIGYSFI
jgi:ADP-ribosyl-[dinitrogen reductase] hydrolase